MKKSPNSKIKREKLRMHKEGSRARQFLFSGGNYVTLVLAVIFCAPSMVMSYILTGLVGVYTLEWVPNTMLALLAFFACAPFCIGAVRVAVSLYCGGERPLSELFFAFSSYGVYLKTLCLALFQVLRLGLLVGLPLFMVKVLKMPWLVTPIVYVLMSFLLSPFKGMLFYTFADGDINIIKGIKTALKNRRRSVLRVLAVDLVTLLMVTVSALPLCMPLVFYTLPFLLCRYVYTAAHSADKEREAIANPEIPENVEGTAPEFEEITDTRGDINNE